MITEIVVEGLATLIEGSGDANLSGLTVYREQQAGDLTYPCAIVTETGAEEHEVIRGNWTLEVMVELKDHAEDETLEAFRKKSGAIGCLVGDADLVKSHLETVCVCYDSMGGQAQAEPEEGYRTSTFKLQIVASER